MIKKQLLIFLDKIKYFGLRKIYYALKTLRRPLQYCFLSLKDLFSPNLSNRQVSQRIIDYFKADDGHNLDRKNISLGFGLIHYSMIRNLKPEKVLCVGSRYGFIPAICALACKDNNKGRVDFVDAGFDQNHPKAWTGVGFWRKTDLQKHFLFLDLNCWLRTYVMSSQDFAVKYLERKYGYIYIDGDHSYKGVKSDYGLFWPRLKKNGFMAFHDIVMRDFESNQPYGVWKFWQELKNIHKITFPFPKESGLGILQKV